jgi:hypothetical protein
MLEVFLVRAVFFAEQMEIKIKAKKYYLIQCLSFNHNVSNQFVLE